MLAHLEAQGLTTVRVRNNREVLSLLRAHDSAVVLGDLDDPQLSGTELCAHIRHQRSFAQVAVILVTESQVARDFLAGLDAGAAYVISKPFSAEYCASRVIAAARQSTLDTKP